MTDRHIATRTSLVPSIAIATQENSCTGSMVKEVVFHNRWARSTEQSATSPVIPNRIMRKIYLRRPSQIFNSKALTLRNGWIQFL